MGLETATYIDGLVPSNPTGTDGRSQGDDHLRLIKSALKNTFPNVNGAVNTTVAQLNSLAAPGAVAFQGMVCMFWGAKESIPAGWLPCDGTNGTPDMRDRFPIGSGLSYPNGSIGGAGTNAFVGTTDGTALTIDQIPPHQHNLTASDFAGAGGGNNPDGFIDGGPVYVGHTQNTGGGQAHSHGFSGQVVTIPPYRALWFIMKT